jgi:hypothetical protein
MNPRRTTHSALCRLFCLITAATLHAAAWAADAQSAPEAAAALELNQPSFNPSAEEHLTLTLGDESIRSVQVYDPDGALIRTLDSPGDEAGEQPAITWDGRDDSGAIVPDSAYTFALERHDGTLIDPTGWSGGEVQDIRDLGIADTGALSYGLPAPARVLIRLGVRNGPMYRTLVDWDPRPAGRVVEPWDGFDADGLVRLREQEGFTVLLTYSTLPDWTVITYGNTAERYPDYKRGRGKDRPTRPPEPADAQPRPGFRPTNLVPPAWARAPRVSMAFPDGMDTAEVARVRQSVKVRIDVAAADKPRLMEDQFEVLLFVDGQFFAEAERGYLPLNWTWELDQFPPGEHILTVNISSFRGQVGVTSRKILLEP